MKKKRSRLYSIFLISSIIFVSLLNSANAAVCDNVDESMKKCLIVPLVEPKPIDLEDLKMIRYSPSENQIYVSYSKDEKLLKSEIRCHRTSKCRHPGTVDVKRLCQG